ncbi:MAG: PQQ-binding-like beta-propeller repeat protein [Halobacteriaceae archaeon]
MVRRREFLLGLGSGLAAAAGCSAPVTDGRTETTAADSTTTEATATAERSTTAGEPTTRSTTRQTTTAGSDSANWPMYGFDAAHTGYNPEATGPAGPVSAVWQRGMPGATRTTAPAVVDGAVFVANVWEGICFDADTGDIAWRTDTGTYNSFHSPGVADGTVYIAGRYRDAGEEGLVTRDLTVPGALTALSAEDGSVRWTRETHISSSPVIHGGRVYYTAMDGNGGGAVRAVDPTDGSDLWGSAFEGDLPVARVTEPAVADGTVYVTLAHKTKGRAGRVVALSAADGTRQWAVRTDAKLFSAPSVADGTVYAVSTTGGVYALDADDGTEQWRASPGVNRAVDVPPTVAEGTVFVGGRDGVAALDAADGSTRWTHGMSLSLTTPAIADGTLYLGGDRVAALSTADGAEQWTFVNEGFHSAYAGPTVTDGTVHVTTCIKEEAGDLYDHAVVALRGE